MFKFYVNHMLYELVSTTNIKVNSNINGYIMYIIYANTYRIYITNIHQYIV